MQRGERDLGGADEEQLVVRRGVDLLLGVRQEAGAVQSPLAHQDRRDHRFEALPGASPAPTAPAQARASRAALEIGEARARQAARRVHVDQPPGQLEMVAGGEAGPGRRRRPRAPARPRGAGALGGSGRFGSVASSLSSVSTTASSSRARLARAATSRIGSIRGPAPRRRRPSGSALVASFCAARNPSSSGSSGRRRGRAAIICSRPPGTRSPRRARAARTRRGLYGSPGGRATAAPRGPYLADR